MAGRISEADKERVRDAVRIDEVVGEYVALRPAGGGNLKGLCPFHDEKSPSFHVSPTRAGGRYHCFGCQRGGDVFEFLMEMEHFTFVEAVERLAERAGIALTLVEGSATRSVDRGSRSRLLAVNRAAADFYAGQLAAAAAEPARAYLTERGFDAAAAAHFGCGYAPAAWDALVKELTSQGFSLEELYKAGVARQGQRGPLDQFHRRLLWPIKDGAGDVVGFGARRLYDDDRIEAKYVNTSETVLFRKSQLLFGLDLAKREISRQRTAVVVEGYTDVMAMHLAGVTTAVASCGTAFGEEHVSVLRRYLADSEDAKVIYTFDGDAAGQKAALKAFDADQRFLASTYVCIAPDGMDPCELRQSGGDQSIRDLLAHKEPLFAFAIRQSVDRFDLDTVEGRVEAAAAAVPLVARIRRQDLREEHARALAGLLGADHQEILGRVRRAVSAAAKAGDRRPGGTELRRAAGETRSDRRPGDVQAESEAPPGPVAPARPDPASARLFAEREALKLALQDPALVAGGYRMLDEATFTDPAYEMVNAAVLAAGGPGAAGGDWVAEVTSRVPGSLRSLVSELSVEPVRRLGGADAAYAGAVLAGLAEAAAGRRERAVSSDLQRAVARGDQQRTSELNLELTAVIGYRRLLRDRANGSEA